MKKMGVGKRIRMVRKEKNWTLEDLGKETGLSVSFLSDIEREVSNPSLSRLKEIAEGLGVSMSQLLGEDDSNKIKAVKVPVIQAGKIGIPLFAKDNIKGYEFISEDKIKEGSYFILEITDDSMNGSGIMVGSKVLIRKDNEIKNNQLSAVKTENEGVHEIVLRKVIKTGDQILLQPTNASYDPLVLPLNEVKIIGKAVAVYKEIN